MSAPGVAASMNIKRESEKEMILRIAQKANHLTESLVSQSVVQDAKRKS